ncbi:MAG: potassium channel family protein, partial [Actinomycetota bacterium]|nr:potassium channel family protein [Actinomycetota bacterium]
MAEPRQATTTTVGYGDTYPATPIGRFVATFVMVTGIGLVGAVSASIAGWVMQRKAHEAPAEGAETGAVGAAGTHRRAGKARPATPNAPRT